MPKFLVTTAHAVTGSIIRAETPEKAALEAFKRKRLSGMPGGVRMGSENFVTVYALGPSFEFRPTIDYTLTGVEERP